MSRAAEALRRGSFVLTIVGLGALVSLLLCAGAWERSGQSSAEDVLGFGLIWLGALAISLAAIPLLLKLYPGWLAYEPSWVRSGLLFPLVALTGILSSLLSLGLLAALDVALR